MRYIKLFTMLCFNFQATQAQDSVAVTTLKSVEAACDIAIKNNPDYEIYGLRVQKAEKELKSSKSYLWPTVSGTFSGQDNLTLATTPLPGELFGQPGDTRYAQFGQPYAFNAGISASMALLDWHSSLQSQVARNEVALRFAEQEAYKQQLTQQAAFYYYATLIAHEAEKLNKENVEVFNSILLLTRQKREQGLVNESIYNQAKIVHNNARKSLNDTHLMLNKYYLQLKLLIGLSYQDSLVLEGLIEVNPTNELGINLGEDRNPQVAQLRLDRAKVGVEIGQSAFMPKLSVNAYLGQQQFRDDFGLSFSGSDWSGFSYLGLNLRIPLFTGFSNSNNLKSARIEQRIAEQKWLSETQKSSNQDETLIKDFGKSREQVALSQDNFKLYQSNTELAYQRYEQGLIGLDQYLIASDDLLQAENAYLNALTNLYSLYSIIISRQDI